MCKCIKLRGNLTAPQIARALLNEYNLPYQLTPGFLIMNKCCPFNKVKSGIERMNKQKTTLKHPYFSCCWFLFEEPTGRGEYHSPFHFYHFLHLDFIISQIL